MANPVPVSSYVDEGRGSLTGMDPAASKEIGKIWTNWEARASTTAGYGYVTRDQMNAALATISQRIDGLGTTTVNAPSGGSSVGGGIGIDLRPLNNLWTGSNVWQGGEVLGTPRYRFLGLTSGAVTAFTPTGDSVNLEQSTVAGAVQYQTLVDVQKTSDASVFGGPVGGNAAIFVQHRTGGNASAQYLAWGIRAHAESYTVGNGSNANHVAAGYFIGHNAGVGSIGHGLRVEMWHKATVASNTAHSYGVEATLLRYFLDGKTVAFHARSGASGLYNRDNDYAFLATSNGTKFGTAFSAGSTALGPVNCDMGLDLSYATCNVGAIAIPPNKAIFFNGPQNTAALILNQAGALEYRIGGAAVFSLGNDGTFGMLGGKILNMNLGGVQLGWTFNTGGAMQYVISGGPVFSLGNDGNFFVHQPNTVPPQAGDPPGITGCWLVSLGGFFRRIPFF